VNAWYKDIRKVTTLEHPIENGTALAEINFWAQMERSLNSVKEQLMTRAVQETLNVLSQAKMYRVVMSFQHDTDIHDKLKMAKEYNKLLKEIPIKSLLDALTLEQIETAIKKIFTALKRVRQLGSYPLDRAINLAEVIARDFDTQLKKVVSQRPIMQIPYSDYKTMQKDLKQLYSAWTRAIGEFKQGIGNKLHSQIGAHAHKIEERLNQMVDDPVFRRLNAITNFRSEHHKLEEVISATFAKDEQKVAGSAGGSSIREQALTDMREAYEIFAKSINVLDITKDG